MTKTNNCLFCTKPTASKPHIGHRYVWPTCCLSCWELHESHDEAARFSKPLAGETRIVPFRSALGGWCLAELTDHSITARPEFGTHGSREDAQRLADELCVDAP